MIYNLKKKETQKMIISSFLKSFYVIIVLHIVNNVVFFIKSQPVESVAFSKGLFYINGESILFSLSSTFKMFLVLLVVFIFYGFYKIKKESQKNEHI